NKIAGADEGMALATGDLVARFENGDNFALATAGTPVELEFAWTKCGEKKLVITVHKVYLPRPTLAIAEAGGIEANSAWRHAKDATMNRGLTAVLTNDVSDY